MAKSEINSVCVCVCVCILSAKLETQTHQILNKLTTSNSCEQLEKKASTPLRSDSDTLRLKPFAFFSPAVSKHTHVGDKANGAPGPGTGAT